MNTEKAYALVAPDKRIHSDFVRSTEEMVKHDAEIEFSTSWDRLVHDEWAIKECEIRVREE